MSRTQATLPYPRTVTITLSRRSACIDGGRRLARTIDRAVEQTGAPSMRCTGCKHRQVPLSYAADVTAALEHGRTKVNVTVIDGGHQ